MSASRRITFSSLALLALAAAPAGAAVPDAGGGAPLVQLRQGGSTYPIAIAISGDRVYVADFAGDRIEVLSRAGAPIGAWGTTGSGPGEFRGPAGIAVGPEGTVYVTDLHNRRVQSFRADGTPISSWPAGEDAAPFGIAVDRAGRVYTTDLDAGTVVAWSADGAERRAWTLAGARGTVSEPWGIAVDAMGDLVVADHGNHRVLRFSREGAWLGGFGERGVGEDQLLGPMGIATGPDGSVFVSDLSGSRVRRFTRDGRLLARWQSPAMVGAVAGLALDARGALFLADPVDVEIDMIAAANAAGAEALPAAFALRPVAHPVGEGPFTVELAIPARGTLGGAIYALDGRRVHAIPDAPVEAGLGRITWDARTDDGRRAPAGMYFARVTFADGTRLATRTARLVVLR
jgi:DNA-binding beta-propeller fold protein YncE